MDFIYINIFLLVVFLVYKDNFNINIFIALIVSIHLYTRNQYLNNLFIHLLSINNKILLLWIFY